MLDTDEEMILQIQAGHRELLELLIKKHYETVYGYCYRRIGERGAAQDLTQDVFVRVVQNLDNYRHHGKFLNYLFVVAGNLCRDYCKKHKPVYVDDLDLHAGYYPHFHRCC